MAKAKSTDAPLELEFPRTGNAWIDAGIVGLFRVLNRFPAYVDEVAEPEGDDPATAFPDVTCDALAADRFTITGPANQVQGCLEQAYDRLIATYYNVSSKKQREERGSYNFYYDSASKQFVLFTKKKAVGAASLLFDKAARPAGTQVAWGKGDTDKKEAGRLPPTHAYLQDQLDRFLAQEGIKAGPPAGMLLDGPNQVRPKVEIRADAGGTKGTCFLTGESASFLIEAKETAFPLMGGSCSFVNGSEPWPRLGWKADLVGKFVPAVAFFYRQDDDLHIFFPQANDLRRLNDLTNSLLPMVELEPNLYRNFQFAKKLGGYFSGRSEVTMAFLHRVFIELSKEPVEVESTPPELVSLFDDEPVKSEDIGNGESPVEVEADPEPVVVAKDVFDATQRKGPVGFAVVSAVKKGNIWMARDFWTFRDVVYLARLFARMQRPVHQSSQRIIYECSPGYFFRTLVDHDAQDSGRTLIRDRLCAAVLRRQPVLHLIEQHAFRVGTRAEARRSAIQPLLAFARIYEIEIRKGTPMEHGYQHMVRTATSLGDTIGRAVITAVLDKKTNESRGQARGSLFRLRKTRTTGDFMNELARLQLRYKITVTPDALDGRIFNPETFEEFRGFCVVSALNSFLALDRTPTPAITPTK